MRLTLSDSLRPVDGNGGFLGAIPAEDLRMVRASMRRRSFAKGEVIFHEGDPGDTLHVIEKGYIAIRATTPLGDTATFTILTVGDTFGELSMLRPAAIRTASAVAVQKAETLSMGRQLLEELRAKGPAADRFIQAVLAAQVERLSAHLLDALHCPADKRILRRLIEVGGIYGADDGKRIPITQDDLASLAGTTRSTVNRLLKALEAADIVEVSRGAVVVLDGEQLQRKAR